MQASDGKMRETDVLDTKGYTKGLNQPTLANYRNAKRVNGRVENARSARYKRFCINSGLKRLILHIYTYLFSLKIIQILP